ncbi:MAG: hypothetical protein JSW07_13640 [bacterium]|nr:MAG: hypothetical protein JSW07_13640 [bacterium]
MNVGAKVATGDVFWFIYADCRPHSDSIDAMRKALMNENIVSDAFMYRLNHPGFKYRLAQTLSNYKNRLLHLLFGNMGICVRRNIFQKMGGYKEIPLMEDMDFCKRFKQYDKIVTLPQKMTSYARRWIEEGYVLNSLRRKN